MCELDPGDPVNSDQGDVSMTEQDSGNMTEGSEDDVVATGGYTYGDVSIGGMLPGDGGHLFFEPPGPDLPGGNGRDTMWK